MSPSGNLQIFSPQNFSEYIGQPKAKKIALVMVNAARIENRSLPNILISGVYGTGKSSLGKILRYETGEKALVYDAAAINKNLPNFNKPIIIDEAHNLDPQVADSLNIIMDAGKAKIIACTTNPGALPAPFRSRFRAINLERYTIGEIKQIIIMAAQRKGVAIDTSVVTQLAIRSRLNPRVALNNLAFVFDFVVVRGLSTVPMRVAQEAFDTLGVDKNGFTTRDYQYMEALPVDRPVGIHYLSSVTGIDAKTIESEIEPYLLQTGRIDRMPRGRVKLKEL